MYSQAQRKQLPPVASIPYMVPNPHWLFGHLLVLHRCRTWVEGQHAVFCQHAGGNVAYITSFWWSHRPAVSALHADAVHFVLRRSHDRIALPAIRRHYAKLLGDNTLVFARGKEWRDKRKLIHTAFVDQALQHAQQTIWKMSLRIEQAMINTCHSSSVPAEQSLQQLQQQQLDDGWHVEVYRLCKMATLDVFGMTALGYDFGCSSTGVMTSEHSSIFRQTEYCQQELTRRCFEERFNILAQYYWIPTPRNIRYARELKQYRQVLLNIVSARRAELKKLEEDKERQQQHEVDSKVALIPNDSSGSSGDTNEDKKNDRRSPATHTPKDGCDQATLLDYLLRGSDKKGAEPLSDDQYLAEFLSSIVVAGYDSTALALSYTMYLLATHPEHQDRCAEEAIRVLGESCSGNKPPDSFLSITDLPYCYAALLESLRYYPPIALTSRDLTKPISLDIHIDPDTGKRTTVEIPAGVRFFVPFYCVNHAEFNYPRPDDYLPERWVQPADADGVSWEARTEENDRGGSVPLGKDQQLLTFSAGARSCVGRPLAMRLMTTLLAVMVRSFHMELADPNYKIELKRFGLTQIPKGGIPLILRRRTLSSSSS